VEYTAIFSGIFNYWRNGGDIRILKFLIALKKIKKNIAVLDTAATLIDPY